MYPRKVAPTTFTINNDSEAATVAPRESSITPPIRYLSNEPSAPPKKTKRKSLGANLVIFVRVQDVVRRSIFLGYHLDDSVPATFVSAHSALTSKRLTTSDVSW